MERSNSHTHIPGLHSVVSPRWLRRQNLPYIAIWIIYYAWVIIFSTWWTASPLAEHAFGTGIRNLMHVVTLVSSAAFVFIIRRQWFVIFARVGALPILAGMLLFLFAADPTLQLVAALTISVSLGCVNIGILMPFIFALNNTEKLYAVVGSNVLICAVSLALESGLGTLLGRFGEAILSLGIMVVALSFVLFFKRESVLDGVPKGVPNGALDDALEGDSEHEPLISRPKMNLWVWVTIPVSMVLGILCKGAGRGLLNISALTFGQTAVIWHYVGGLLGCLILLVVFAFARRSVQVAVNITFGVMATGLFLNAFTADMPHLSIPFALFTGVTGMMGMMIVYYILGVIGKKYGDMLYIRLSILLIGIGGGAAGVLVGNLITTANTSAFSIGASLVSVVALVLFLVLSPSFFAAYYANEWVTDSERAEIGDAFLAEIAPYDLSRREVEVCRLLLQGHTMRQVSGILSIAYPTVNTYCNSLYRKLAINSRTELFIRFKDFVARDG
jgi:DNA-binding CsgD family transcriptional regulator